MIHNKMSTNLVSASLLSLCITASLSGASSAQTFRWAPPASVATMDPHASGDTTTRNILINDYEGLVRLSQKAEIEPELAVSWEAVEPTVWRFKLRPNVTFHDGSPFTADDVVFSFKRATASSSDIRSKLRAIKEMRKVDDLTVDAITRAPNPILAQGVLLFMPILSQEWAKKHDAMDPADNRRTGKENYATRNANGTGPFKIVSFGVDGRIEMVPNENWWDKKEYNFNKVVISPIASDATRVAALLSGEVDLITPIPQQDVPRVKDSKDFQILTIPDARVVYLGMDQWRDELKESNVKGKNPFKDIRVRQAFVKAINMDLVRSKILMGAGLPVYAMVPPQADGWIDAFRDRPAADPAGAKKLLSDAGYPNGFSVGMDCPNDGLANMGEPVCVAITGMLARVGIKVDVQLQKQAMYAGKIGRRDTSFYIHSWGATTLDALATMGSTMVTYGDGVGTWNVGGYSNPEFDRLVAAAESEMDRGKRRELMTKALKIHRDDVGTIPLYQPVLTYAARSNVTIVPRLDDAIQLRWVKFK